LFIENDGDLRKTAEELFVHINTVRYRIDKIKKILNLENSSWAFNEQLSLAIKADKILNCF
jgi:DNA-binding PucR family transcriptional regulator